MFKPYEIFIGLRYLRAKRRNHFISVISLISMLGIAVGVAALITVISVMNGFETELRERILSMTSHATITNEAYQLGNWTEVVDTAERHERVIGAAPYVRGEAMLSHSGELSGALVRGVDPDEESKVSEIADNMVVGTLGDLIPGEYGVVLGSELALMLNVYVGDKIVMMISQGNVTPAGIVPRLRRFTVTGIFEVGMAQYDNGLAIINIEDASRLFGLQGDVSGVRLKLDDMFYASRVVREVAYELGDTYYVSDWTRQHTNLFRAIKTEKTVMFVILFLIVAVAAFNIISTLVMVVTDKQADIAILRTLGALPGSVMSMFIVQGALIGVLGTIAGTILGIILSLNVETIVPAIERFMNVDFLPADVYYISDLPSEMHTVDVIKISAGAFLLSLLSTIYPAVRAAHTHPAEALRYE